MSDNINEKDLNSQSDPIESEGRKSKKHKEHKKFKHGMMSTVFTIVFIAVIVLVNIVATALFDKYPITIDLTKDKIFSISEESEEYVKKIDTDVLITVFAKEEEFQNVLGTYSRQADEVMKKYCKYNSKISYRYIDIDSNPDIMKDYADDTISQYDIIVETNPSNDVKRTRKITPLDLVSLSDDYTTNFLQQYTQYGYTEDQLIQQSGGELNYVSLLGGYGYVDGSDAEQAFTSAFMTVTDPNPVTVTFLTGRSEVTELSYFKKLLTANGYNVKTADITAEEIPEDTDVAVVAAPKTDYLPEEINKLSKFIDNDNKLGKQLLYIASLQQLSTPNLDEFLAEYGIKVGQGLICETYAGNYANQKFNTISTDISDKFTQDIGIDDPKLLVQGSRPIELLFSEKERIATEAYVKSSDDAYVLESVNSEEVLAKGKQNYVAVASRTTSTDDGSQLYSNVIVFGSEYILCDTDLQYNQYQNRAYFLSLLNGVTHKTDGVIIEPKTIEGNIYDITEAQKTTLKWTFILIIPAVVLVVGTVIWLRRKNR